jgi:hypothetical protein
MFVRWITAWRPNPPYKNPNATYSREQLLFRGALKETLRIACYTVSNDFDKFRNVMPKPNNHTERRTI